MGLMVLTEQGKEEKETGNFGNGARDKRQSGQGTEIKQANVGIGTTNPTSKLLVVDTTAGSGVYGYARRTTGTNYGVVGNADGSGATTNIGLYAAATLGTTNQALYIEASNPGAGANNWALYSASQAQSYFAGNVGIGTTSPGYTLTVSGTSWVTSGAWSGSDVRWKQNITSLQNSLDRVMQLKPVNFLWKNVTNMTFPNGTQIGFIAQDVEKVIPEVVTTDNNGYKGISYERITPVLTGAIQELKTNVVAIDVDKQKQIDALKAENEQLKAKNNELERRIAALENGGKR
ncbi:MAG: tail fiber domain-containing protein [Candidatus Aenigmatarchaeota archaeon]